MQPTHHPPKEKHENTASQIRVVDFFPGVMLTTLHSTSRGALLQAQQQRQVQQRGTGVAELFGGGYAGQGSGGTGAGASASALPAPDVQPLTVTGAGGPRPATPSRSVGGGNSGQGDVGGDPRADGGAGGEDGGDGAGTSGQGGRRAPGSGGGNGKGRWGRSVSPGTKPRVVSRYQTLTAEQLREQQLLAMQHEMWLNSRQLPNSAFKHWGLKPFTPATSCGCRACGDVGACRSDQPPHPSPYLLPLCDQQCGRCVHMRTAARRRGGWLVDVLTCTRVVVSARALGVPLGVVAFLCPSLPTRLHRTCCSHAMRAPCG